MRHPRPMEHIATMLLDPSFEESLSLPTAEYVRQHDLEQRITNALGSAGFVAGEALPADMSSRLSVQLLAHAKPQPAAHSEVVQAAVQAAKAMLESAPLPSEGETGAEQDSSSAWSCRTWAASLPLGELLIKALCGPVEELVKDWPAHTRSAAELAYVRHLFKGISGNAETEVAALLRPALAECTKQLVVAGQSLIKEVVTEQELSAKFCTEKGKELIFGGLESFNAGLEAVVGPPNPDLWASIRKEHTDSADSWAFFTTTNYGVKTKPAYEYWFVVDSIKGKAEIAKYEGNLTDDQVEKLQPGDPVGEWGGTYPVEEVEKLPQRKQRFAVPLESFEASLAAINAQLRRKLIKPLRSEELLCCRLYTGPMYMKFNVVMRGASASGKLLGKPDWAVAKFKAECRGNKYSTTISAVNSAIIKLSKQTTVNKVYRGVSGFGLPKILTEKNEHNVIGGVEFAFLSTTLDRDVAMKYARGHSDPASGFGVVLEITPGLVDRGADLSWVSQYPFEQAAPSPSP